MISNQTGSYYCCVNLFHMKDKIFNTLLTIYHSHNIGHFLSKNCGTHKTGWLPGTVAAGTVGTHENNLL